MYLESLLTAVCALLQTKSAQADVSPWVLSSYDVMKIQSRQRGVVLKRKAAPFRHLFTCTSNRRKIENVKIALRLFRPPPSNVCA